MYPLKNHCKQAFCELLLCISTNSRAVLNNSAVCETYKYIHNNASDCMKKSRNDSLYKVGKYEQFTDSINFTTST